MKTRRIINVAIGFIIGVSVTDFCLELISAPNTIENIIGFFAIIAIVVILFKTKFLTTIKF